MAVFGPYIRNFSKSNQDLQDRYDWNEEFGDFVKVIIIIIFFF